jgi:Protein of unknown function (DUF2752)
VKAWVSSAIAIALLVGGWVVYTYPPTEHTFYPRCVFKSATGLACPGCGLTRATHHALHGRLGEAARFNPLLFAMVGVALCAVPSVVRGRKPRFVTQPWFGWVTVIVVAGWWIVRNVIPALRV